MQQSPSSAPRRRSQGYAKGDDTRARLVEEALRIFGERGYAAATTRELASAAGTTLPSLTYYFGGKEGLHIACAEAVVHRFEQAIGEAAAAARVDLQGSLDPAGARGHLKSVFRALASLVREPDAVRAARFAHGIFAEPGPAFDLLYTRLWGPGIELSALLIERASGGRIIGSAAKMRTIMMISSLASLSSGRAVVIRAIGTDATNEDVGAEMVAVLDEQIDHLSDH